SLDRRRRDGQVVLGGKVVEVIAAQLVVRRLRVELAEALPVPRSRIRAAEDRGLRVSGGGTAVADVALAQFPAQCRYHLIAKCRSAEGVAEVVRVLRNHQSALRDAAAAAGHRAA